MEYGKNFNLGSGKIPEVLIQVKERIFLKHKVFYLERSDMIEFTDQFFEILETVVDIDLATELLWEKNKIEYPNKLMFMKQFELTLSSFIKEDFKIKFAEIVRDKKIDDLLS